VEEWVPAFAGKRGKICRLHFQRDFFTCAQRGAGPDRVRDVFAVDRLTLVFVAAVFLAGPVFFAVLVFFATSVAAPFLAAFAEAAFADADLDVLRPRFLPLSRCAASSGSASAREKVAGSALRGNDAITPSWLT
jgi:hypothetical protein